MNRSHENRSDGRTTVTEQCTCERAIARACRLYIHFQIRICSSNFQLCSTVCMTLFSNESVRESNANDKTPSLLCIVLVGGVDTIHSPSFSLVFHDKNNHDAHQSHAAAKRSVAFRQCQHSFASTCTVARTSVARQGWLFWKAGKTLSLLFDLDQYRYRGWFSSYSSSVSTCHDGSPRGTKTFCWVWRVISNACPFSRLFQWWQALLEWTQSWHLCSTRFQLLARSTKGGIGSLPFASTWLWLVTQSGWLWTAETRWTVRWMSSFGVVDVYIYRLECIIETFLYSRCIPIHTFIFLSKGIRKFWEERCVRFPRL